MSEQKTEGPVSAVNCPDLVAMAKMPPGEQYWEDPNFPEVVEDQQGMLGF